MFQQEVEELFYFQSDWCLHCYICYIGRWSGAFKSGSQTVIYSDLPFAHILCPAVPFNAAPALECLLPYISRALCFPIRRALLRLAPGSPLPALQRECQLRSSAFTNQTDNLSLRWCSRKSKNFSISSQTGALLLRHGGRWSLVCLQIRRSHPGRTWCRSQLFKYFKFLSDARIIWITSRCQYYFLFHATLNPAIQASFSKNAQKQWFLLLLGPCISDILPHLGRRRKRESAPQAFLRGRTGSYVLCSGFGNFSFSRLVCLQIPEPTSI